VTGQFTYAWEFTGTASQIAKAFDHVKYLNNTGKTHEVELKVFNGKETVIR
jgi:flavoprotein